MTGKKNPQGGTKATPRIPQGRMEDAPRTLKGSAKEAPKGHPKDGQMTVEGGATGWSLIDF